MLVGDVLVVHVKSQVKLKQEQEVYQVYRECRKWWFIMNVRDSRGRGYPAYKNDSQKKKEEPGIKEKRVLHRSVDHTFR